MNDNDQHAIQYLKHLIDRIEKDEITIERLEFQHETLRHEGETHYHYSYKGVTDVSLGYRVVSMKIPNEMEDA